MDGKQRLEVLHGIFHRTGNALTLRGNGYPQWAFRQGLYRPVPLSDLATGECFKWAAKFGAVSFLQIVAPELSDRMLADFMDAENGLSLICTSEYRPQRSNQDD